MTTFRETNAGNFIIYMGREPLSTKTKPLSQLPTNIPLSKLKVSRHNGWSDMHPDALYKSQIQAFAAVGIHTLNDLFAARAMPEVSRILQMEYCGEVVSEFNKLCRVLQSAPAVLDSDYVPPTVIHFDSFNIMTHDLPDSYWSDLEASERNEIRESIKTYLAENVSDIMKEAFRAVHEAKVARLRQELEEAVKTLDNL